MLSIEKEIFNINSDAGFSEMAIKVFHFQYHNNSVYQNWVNQMNINPEKVNSTEKIPFLPIGFFKNNRVISGNKNNSTVFTSSSTTSQTPSKHYVNKIEMYEESFTGTFEMFYGACSQYCIIALLPGYVQRGDSSLIYMVKKLIEKSENNESRIYDGIKDELISQIESLKKGKQKVILIGVSYALMDLSKMVQLSYDFIVMETGGMKGKRRELTKAELHEYLKKGFAIKNIESEYGMTELLSQAYSKGNGLYECAPWMKFFIREITDPLKLIADNKTGGINVIDLANLYSCSFIATQDLGKLNKQNQLQLMGRFDHSDVRGCNLMAE